MSKAIMAENFHNLGREMDILIHKVPRTTPLSEMIIKSSRVKTKNFESSKKKKKTVYKGTL